MATVPTLGMFILRVHRAAPGILKMGMRNFGGSWVLFMEHSLLLIPAPSLPVPIHFLSTCYRPGFLLGLVEDTKMALTVQYNLMYVSGGEELD